MWSVDPHDWKNRNAKITAAGVINRAHPGAIVVLHDPLPSTAKALPRILSELESRGYHFVTVTELLGELSPGVVYESSQD
jgi:peptidoglycan/xylan/chitin deacetylase (PgdA/CDA1 family)